MSDSERYLIDVDLSSIPELRTNALIIGSGIAGLAAAISAAQKGLRVVVVTKESINETATTYAQGGIAAALAPEDSIKKHIADTLDAGQGLCEEDAVEVLARDGADLCQRLIDSGAPFDRDDDGQLHFTMEGAHSSRRILHGDGDATGRVLQEYLSSQLKRYPNITVYENHFVIDLLHQDGECLGALLLDTSYGRMLSVRAGGTVIASGGAGQLFRETTNPLCATGDGYALAFRAGAVLRDMEFVQFHPTTLYLAGAPRFLISESVRGEGAVLVNQDGQRFMSKYDSRADLAPRDIVSQSIMRELHSKEGATSVYLDLRHLEREMVATRFPNISRICGMYGIDLASDLVPVRPAAHYFMGGIKTDLNGATNIKRLYAAGESASTGVHGANRLASNSLLEGLVFGHRCGVALADEAEPVGAKIDIRHNSNSVPAPLDLNDMLQSLKALCWRDLGVFRSQSKLEDALKNIAFWERYVLAEQFSARGGFELQNLLLVARILVNSALMREESRGAHQRTDFPAELPQKTHTELSFQSFA